VIQLAELLKKEIRTIWVIQTLLNDEKKFQQDILKELNKIGIEIREKRINEIENEFLAVYSSDNSDDEFFNEVHLLPWKKTYNIHITDIEEAFFHGLDGNINYIETLLEDTEGLEADELDKIDLDDYPSEIGLLMELRELYAERKKKITDPTLSTILKKLRDDNIIETVPGISKGRGPSPNTHYLNQNVETIRKVLKILNNPKLPLFYSKELSSTFMESKYFQNFLDGDIVEKLEAKLDVSISKEEKNIILNIISISPKALLTVLEYLKSQYILNKFLGPLIIENKVKRKELLLYYLMAMFGEDMNYIKSNNVQFKIIISFNQEPSNNKFLSQSIEMDSICSVILPNKKVSIASKFKDNQEHSPI